MGIFDAHLTIKEKADKGQLLPEILNTRDIAVLFSDDSRKQNLISQAMAGAIASRKLKINAIRDYSSTYINECGRVYVVWIYQQGEDKGIYAQPVEIHKDSFLDWFKSEGEELPADSLLSNWLAAPQTEAVTIDDIGSQAAKQKPLRQLLCETNNQDDTKPYARVEPWLNADPKDPQPSQPWYTAARYFARQLVIDDSILLTKSDILANKVVKLLTKKGIYKRGGKKPFDPGTIKKALSNVILG